MAKYLITASYSAAGAKGILTQGGGSARRTAVEEAIQSVGGTVESFYFAFGDTDAFVIVDLPDHASAAAVSLAACASGAAGTKTMVLLTPEEMDQAAQKSVNYRPPGQ